MFAFSNLRYGIGYAGKALGVLICGLVFNLGLRYIFGICVIFLFVQIALGLYLIKLRKDEKQMSCEKEISAMENRKE